MALDNQALLITGGASGIGQSISAYLLSQRAKVMIMDLNKDAGERQAEEYAKTYGIESVGFTFGDVSSETDANQAIEACKDKFGKLDVLVNNAGIGCFMSMYNPQTGEVHDLERFQRVLQVNTIGTFNMSRLAAKEMAGNKPDEDGQRGLIVNISSISGMESTFPGETAYAASKAAINGMTLVMARDLAPVGIRVMTVCPGPIETPAFKSFLEANPGKDLHLLFPTRPGRPEEIAQVIQLIIQCKFVNGTCWRVDGGCRI